MTALIMGGAASGKSEYAETLTVAAGLERTYIATLMRSGREDDARILRHREMRARKGFQTVERYLNLSGLRLPARGAVLLECLGNLTANEIFAEGGAGRDAVEAVTGGVRALAAQCETLIVVTNDVFCDGAVFDPETRFYLDALGRINALLAASFDRVYEVVCGIPIQIK